MDDNTALAKAIDDNEDLIDYLIDQGHLGPRGTVDFVRDLPNHLNWLDRHRCLMCEERVAVDHQVRGEAPDYNLFSGDLCRRCTIDSIFIQIHEDL